MTASEYKSTLLPCYDAAYHAALAVLHDSDTARDIVQELYRRLWEGRDDIQLPQSPRSFCAISARNAALSWLRANPPGKESGIDESICRTPDIPDEADPRAALLQTAINSLDQRRKSIIQMSLDGKSNQEIAQAVGIAEDNLRRLLSRTRKQLRQLILSLLNSSQS